MLERTRSGGATEEEELYKYRVRGQGLDRDGGSGVRCAFVCCVLRTRVLIQLCALLPVLYPPFYPHFRRPFLRPYLPHPSNPGTFQLTSEPLMEPVERLAAAIKEQGLGEDEFVVLEHGETRAWALQGEAGGVGGGESGGESGGEGEERKT